MKKDIVLFIGGGASQIKYIERIKALGYRVIATDINPDAPARDIVDGFINVSTYDAAGTWKGLQIGFKGELKQIKQVMTACTGEPFRTVETLKAKLGLKHIDKRTMNILLNKTLLRKVFNKAKLSSIKTWKNIKSVREQDLPVVIKPATSGLGGKGVNFVYRLDQLKPAYADAVKYSLKKDAVIETYVEGPEIAVDAIWNGKKVVFLSTGWTLFDNELGEITGSTAEADDTLTKLRGKITHMIEDLCRIFRFGPLALNCDIILSENMFLDLIEAEFLPVHGVFLCKGSYGYDLLGNYVNVHLGLPVAPQPPFRGSSALFYDVNVQAKRGELKYIKLLEPWTLESNNGSFKVKGYNLLVNSKRRILDTVTGLFPHLSNRRTIID
jgi:ATP-grasp domain